MDKANASGAVQGRSTLGTVIRVLVWTAVISTIATPVLLFATLNVQIGRALLPFWTGAGPAEYHAAGPNKPQTIPTRGLDAERGKQVERLLAFTGTPEMASGAARSLHIVAIRFDSTKPTPRDVLADPGKVIYPDGYWRMTLDMNAAEKQAVLLVGDEPARWTVTGQEAGDWPRIGFEGYAAFDIDTAERGSIAGFRIAAFGESDTVKPVDPKRDGVSAVHSLCRATGRWSDFFAVPYDKVRFTLVVNPSRISIGRATVESDGRIGRSLDRRQMLELCGAYLERRR